MMESLVARENIAYACVSLTMGFCVCCTYYAIVMLVYGRVGRAGRMTGTWNDIATFAKLMMPAVRMMAEFPGFENLKAIMAQVERSKAKIMEEEVHGVEKEKEKDDEDEDDDDDDE